MLITGAAILFSAGSIALVMNISTAGVCRYLCGDASHWPNWITWVALVLIGLGAGIAGIAWARVKGKPNGRTMIDNYSHALIGLGFALMLLATLNFVALAGFASQGVLEAVLGNQEDLVLTRLCDKLHARVEHDHSATELAESGDDGAQAGPGDRDGGADGVQDGQGGRVGAATDAENRPLDPKLYTLRLLLLPGFAVLGAVFFVGGAMRRKRDASEKLEAIRRKNAQTANTNPNVTRRTIRTSVSATPGSGPACGIAWARRSCSRWCSSFFCGRACSAAAVGAAPAKAPRISRSRGRSPTHPCWSWPCCWACSSSPPSNSSTAWPFACSRVWRRW
jgi:hypothetical protein